MPYAYSTGIPAPAVSGLKKPPAIVVRRPTPRLVTDPSPSIPVLPNPAAGLVRSPPRGNHRAPNISIRRHIGPASVGIEVLGAIHSWRHILRALRCGDLLIAAVAPAVPVVVSEGCHDAEFWIGG